MSTDARDAEALLAAAGQSTDRTMRIIYAAEARILIERDRERLRQQAIVLDAFETELARTGPSAQTTLSTGGRK